MRTYNIYTEERIDVDEECYEPYFYHPVRTRVRITHSRKTVLDTLLSEINLKSGPFKPKKLDKILSDVHALEPPGRTGAALVYTYGPSCIEYVIPTTDPEERTWIIRKTIPSSKLREIV